MNNKHSLLQMLPSYMTCSYRPQNATLDQGPPVVVIMAREAGAEPPLYRTDLTSARRRTNGLRHAGPAQTLT